MRYLLTTTLLTAALALPLGSASAQRVNEDVMAKCNQAVGQMKFEGWPADRNREMMTAACQHAGGTVPGAQDAQQQQERPASLSQKTQKAQKVHTRQQ